MSSPSRGLSGEDIKKSVVVHASLIVQTIAESGCDK